MQCFFFFFFIIVKYDIAKQRVRKRHKSDITYDEIFGVSLKVNSARALHTREI